MTTSWSSSIFMSFAMDLLSKGHFP